jgi:hypothetical protein
VRTVFTLRLGSGGACPPTQDPMMCNGQAQTNQKTNESVVLLRCSFHEANPACVYIIHGVSKEFYNGIPNITVWRVLRKRLTLKAYKLLIVQCLERLIVYTPLSVNVFVTLATQ